MFFILRSYSILLARCCFFILLFKFLKSIYCFGFYEVFIHNCTKLFIIYKCWSNYCMWEKITIIYSFFGIFLLFIFSFMDVYTFMYGLSPYWTQNLYPSGYGSGPGGGPPNNGPREFPCITEADREDKKRYINVDRISSERIDKSRGPRGGVPYNNTARPDLNYKCYDRWGRMRESFRVADWLPVYEDKHQVKFDHKGRPVAGAIYEIKSQKVWYYHLSGTNENPTDSYYNASGELVIKAKGWWTSYPPKFGSLTSDFIVGPHSHTRAYRIAKPTYLGNNVPRNIHVSWPDMVHYNPGLPEGRALLPSEIWNAPIPEPFRPLYCPPRR